MAPQSSLREGTAMQTFSLKAKLVVIVRGVLMVLEKRLIDRRLLFFDELGEPTKLSEKEFYEGYEKREIEVSADQPYTPWHRAPL